jgi:hypothetical protein
MSARLAAAWVASLAVAAASGWVTGRQTDASEPMAAGNLVVRPSADRTAKRALPVATASDPPTMAVPPAVPPPVQPAACKEWLQPFESGTDALRFESLVRARALQQPVPDQLLQAMLHGSSLSRLRVAALDALADSLDGDPQALQEMLVQAMQVPDDAVRAEAMSRLEELPVPGAGGLPAGR